MTDAVPTPVEADALREAARRLHRFGGERLVRDIGAIFLDDAPTRLAAARDAVRAGEPRAVEHALHSLKSSAAQMGAVSMQRWCAAGEALAHEGALDRIEPLLDELERDFERVRGWLDHELGGDTPLP